MLLMLKQCTAPCRYGIVLLVVECMGASTVLIYGLHLLYDPVMEDFAEDPNCPGKPLVRLFTIPSIYVNTVYGVADMCICCLRCSVTRAFCNSHPVPQGYSK